MTHTSSFLKTLLMTSATITLLSTGALAMDENTLPEGGDIVGGSADINTSGNYMTVDQHTNRLIIDWDTFNIGENATVEFVQPNSQSIAVNRAGDDGDPTHILGSLKSNGRVAVIDRNGVMFGVGSRVDVGSLIATTGDVSNEDIMDPSNRSATITNFGDGEIINKGTITVAEGGLVAFIGPSITNTETGIIKAKAGSVFLASGDRATVDLAGDGLVEIALDPSNPISKSVITNKGKINASGGNIIITADTANTAVDSVINNTGIIRVASVKKAGGKIVLSADHVRSTGALKASGGTKGGTIKITGNKTVHLDGILRAHDKTPDENRDHQGKVVVTTANKDSFTGKDKKSDWPRVDIFKVKYTDVSTVTPVPPVTTGSFNIEDTFNSSLDYILGRLAPTSSGTGFTILGLPRVSGTAPSAVRNPAPRTLALANNPADLNAITPAAGGDTPQTTSIEALANITPAAGGDEQNASCWGDALNAAQRGMRVSYNFGSGMDSALNDAASCSNGI